MTRKIMFDKKVNRFVGLDKSTDTGWLCSNTEYHADAGTSVALVPHSEEYIKENFVEVIEITDFADFNGIGWKVKKR